MSLIHLPDITKEVDKAMKPYLTALTQLHTELVGVHTALKTLIAIEKRREQRELGIRPVA